MPTSELPIMVDRLGRRIVVQEDGDWNLTKVCVAAGEIRVKLAEADRDRRISIISLAREVGNSLGHVTRTYRGKLRHHDIPDSTVAGTLYMAPYSPNPTAPPQWFYWRKQLAT